MQGLKSVRDFVRGKMSTAVMVALRLLDGWLAECALVAMLLVTGVAINQERSLLDRTRSLTRYDAQQFYTYVYTDAADGGGSSGGVDGDNPFGWNCALTEASGSPYCGFGILLDLDHSGRGVDFSRTETVTLDLTYDGPADHLTLYLKNGDRRYSKPSRSETDKYNFVDFAVRQGRQTIKIPIADFKVPDWWVYQNHVSRALADPQFNNIISIEVTTAMTPPAGRYRATINSVGFNHSILSTEQWHLAIFAAWTALILAFLALRRRRDRRDRILRQKRWETCLDTVPQMVWVASAEGDDYLNARWQEFTGISLRPGNQASRWELLHPDDRSRVKACWSESLATGYPYEIEYRLRHWSGVYRWVLSRGLPEKTPMPGRPLRWYGTCTDIHDRVLATEALNTSESLNRGIIDAIPDCVSLLDLEGTLLFANRPAQMQGGAVDARIGLGRGFLGIFPKSMRARADEMFTKAADGKTGRQTALREDGSWWDTIVAPVLDPTGQPCRIVVVSRDVTEQKDAEEFARWTANHDMLTQLPNRTLLQKGIDEAIEQEQPFALLLVDIDDFKLINDTAGHDAGDALLCAFAERLVQAVGDGGTVGRLGGDEFAIVLSRFESHERLNALVAEIMLKLREPCIHHGHVLDCKGSIGISLFPEHGTARAKLLKNADVALYAAKNSGKGHCQIFRPEMRNELSRRGAMIAFAKAALENDRILPYYQPKIELLSGKPIGFEALLRWRHPSGGVRTPAKIAAAFEDLTLAAEMSEAMITRVIADMRAWQDEGVPFGHVAINAAAAEFRRGDFADRLLERMHLNGIPPEAVQVEVTETVFLGRGAEYVERALKTLSDQGIRIALDDFGTGYASLSHLKDFPVSIIKIDRSFVQELKERRDHAPIIDAVINLARSLNIRVVAEGIESPIQHEFLLMRGCHHGQGHLYSPAVPASRAAAFARRGPDMPLLIAA